MFHVTVRDAAEQIVDLIERLRRMPLDPVIEQRLLQSLNEALGQPRSTAVVCRALRIFAGLVQLQQGGSIPPALASELLTDVTRIRAVLACG